MLEYFNRILFNRYTKNERAFKRRKISRWLHGIIQRYRKPKHVWDMREDAKRESIISMGDYIEKEFLNNDVKK